MKRTDTAASLLPRLEACVERDLLAQQRILELIEAQRRAITDERGKGLEEPTAAMVAELRAAPERAALRDEVLGAFASSWGLPQGEVTLSLVVARLGQPAHRLDVLRADLRQATAEVVRANRRLSALVSLQRRLVHDVLHALLEDERPGRTERPEGVLLDAEA